MTTAPIVLGAECAFGALDALVWALVECRAQGRDLMAVHVRADEKPDEPDAVLDAHVDVAHALAPEIPAAARAAMGTPAPVLIGASERAALIVLGSHGRRGMARSALGSVMQRVAVHAQCPVVVVPPESQTSAWLRPDRIVVGIAPTWAGHRALEHAVLRARLAGAALVLVRSRVPEDGGRCAAAEELAEIRAELIAGHPGLRVEGLAAEKDAAEAVLTAGRAADLVVLGCHHSDDPWNSRLGAVPAGVLAAIRCPVELVGQLH